MQLLTAFCLFGFLGVQSQILQCPHPRFITKHICEDCKTPEEVVAHQRQARAKGLTAVFGPPAHFMPPFFRPSGMDPRDPCLNRQPRAAYRCNMDFKKPYCFKIGSACYGGHSSLTGQLDADFITCVDNYTWERQFQLDDYDTDRRSDPEVQ